MYKQIELNGEKWNYLIYDDGRVYSLYTNKFLSPDTSSGYARYLLCSKEKRKKFTAHMLVGLHFIPNPNNFPILNHKDKNRLNNNVDNLEWISYSNNVKLENRSKYEKIILYFTEEEIANEEWRPFRDGRYWASNLGRLKNNDSGKILNGDINHYLIYMRDYLKFKNGEKQTIPRHHIIWEAFHPNEKIIVINHIDGNRANNRLENLENVTYSENLKKAYTVTKTKKTRKCKGINLKTGEEKLFFSVIDAANYVNCNESNIRAALNLHNKVGGGVSHGWRWHNITEEEYSQILKSSETIESIAKEKDFSE